MSAYVVEDATINRIVTFVALNRDSDRCRRIIKENTGCDLVDPKAQRDLAHEMFKLNCNAVEQRYGEGQAKEFRDLNFEYRHEIHCDRIGVYASLKCWLYQCTEGDVPDTSLLYSTMQRIKSEIADDIVSSLSAYQNAKWE